MASRTHSRETGPWHAVAATIAPVDSGTKYGAGWGFAVTKDGFETHGHTGGGGAYIAIEAIQPARDFAVAIITNIGGDDDVLPEVSKLRSTVTQRLAR